MFLQVNQPQLMLMMMRENVLQVINIELTFLSNLKDQNGANAGEDYLDANRE
jgi:hypothetical protein